MGGANMSRAGDPRSATQFLPAIAAAPEVCLKVYHQDGDDRLVLRSGSAVVLGRGEQADLVMRDRTLSRRHTRISLLDGNVWVEDLDSTNGTFINARRIKKPCLLRAGDELTIGAATVSLRQTADDLQRRLESHDDFVTRVEDELARAQFFRRPLAVLFLQSASKASSLSRWVPLLEPLLRSRIDRMALYSPQILELMLPESDADATRDFVSALQRASGRRAQLRCGACIYPQHASSLDGMIAGALTAVQRTSDQQPFELSSRDGDSGLYASTREEIQRSTQIAYGDKMRSVFETVDILAQSLIPVLIQGETGSGKEVVARTIVERGPRRDRPLQTVNCAAIPEHLVETVLFGHERGAFTGAERRSIGLFEAAGGGTLLLDEIGELAPSVQAALLRVLESKRITRVGSTREIEVDVRVLAATHRNLETMCQEGGFRWDLYYRLNTMTLKVPPLRERREEISPFAQRFAQEAARVNGLPTPKFDRQVLACLQRYDWPGNVRELRNVVDRAVVLARGSTITADDLSDRLRNLCPSAVSQQTVRFVAPVEWLNQASLAKASVGQAASRKTLESPQAEATAAKAKTPAGKDDDDSFRQRVRRYESHLILTAVATAGGNQTAAARALQIPPRTLNNRISSLGLRDALREGTKLPASPDADIWQRCEQQTTALRDKLERFERILIQQALQQHEGNRTNAASWLRLPLRTLLHKIARYELGTVPQSVK